MSYSGSSSLFFVFGPIAVVVVATLAVHQLFPQESACERLDSICVNPVTVEVAARCAVAGTGSAIADFMADFERLQQGKTILPRVRTEEVCQAQLELVE